MSKKCLCRVKNARSDRGLKRGGVGGIYLEEKGEGTNTAFEVSEKMSSGRCGVVPSLARKKASLAPDKFVVG